MELSFDVVMVSPAVCFHGFLLTPRTTPRSKSIIMSSALLLM